MEQSRNFEVTDGSCSFILHYKNYLKDKLWPILLHNLVIANTMTNVIHKPVPYCRLSQHWPESSRQSNWPIEINTVHLILMKILKHQTYLRYISKKKAVLYKPDFPFLYFWWSLNTFIRAWLLTFKGCIVWWLCNGADDSDLKVIVC